MKLSVVVPVYNHSEFLADALLSAVTAPEVSEVVVADDGSSDRSAEVIRYFAERFPEKVRDLTDSPPKNIGAHNRINALCKAASGDWIAVLNSDDTYGHGRFRNLDRLARATKADLVFGNCAIMDGASKKIGYKYPVYDCEYPLPEQLDAGELVASNAWIIALLNQNFIATTSNMVFKKSLWEKLGGFAPYRYVHDWDFLIRAACEGRLVHDPKMWISYRIHSGNTISESAFKVRQEVQRMFAALAETEAYKARLAEYPAGMVAAALRGNRYLHAEPTLALLVSDPPSHPKVQAFLEVFPDAVLATSSDELPETIRYVYAPSSADVILNPNALRNLALSITVKGYDVAAASLTLDEHGLLSAARVRDVAFLRREDLPSLVGKLSARPGRPVVGRIARLPDGAAHPTRALGGLVTNAQLQTTGSEFVLAAGPIEPAELDAQRYRPSAGILPEQISRGFDDRRPTVFVFPGFVAVGGAENIMIEVMKQLKDRYAFVVVCTEQLTPAQGSWAHRALEHCEAVYELAECCRQEDFDSALSWLKAIYQPRLLYLTNGTMWQMKNATRMRKLFRDCAIVDQQVYDSKVGWIEWFDHPGVRAADRFIAVNRRIETTFKSDLALPSGQVDMIYHPIDSARIKASLKGLNKTAMRKQFGLRARVPTVVFVGRMNEQKRPERYLDLARRTKAAGRDVQFVMVGQGPLQDAVDAEIQRDGLDNVVRIKNVKKVEELYAVCDLLVIVSKYEGLPLSMLEAMVAGLPVFSTDVGDISLVLKEYGGHDTVDVDISDDALFSAFVERLDALAELKADAAKVSRKIAQRFGGEAIAKEYDACFKAAMAQLAPERGY